MYDPQQYEENLKRLQYRLNLAKWARDICGFKATWQQEEILESISKPGAKVSAKSGHGTGKSSVGAVIILGFLDLYDECKIPCTAPAAPTLFDNLWAETHKWMMNMTPEYRARFDWRSDCIRMVHNPQNCFATARTSRPEKPEALQGFHAEHLLYCLDEATGIADPIFDPMEGTLTTKDCRVLMLSNPTKKRGYFYRSQTSDERWTRLTLSSEESPRVTKEWCDGIKNAYGEDSNFYRIRVLGEFPKDEDDVLIPIEWIEDSIGRDIVAEGERIAGLDVGSTGDDSALTIRQGHVIIYLDSWHIVDTMVTAGKVADVLKAKKCRRVKVDANGIGLGVAHRLRQLGFEVDCVNSQESSPYKDNFMRLRDQLWWTAREFFEERTCSIDKSIPKEKIDQLMGELSSMHYETTSSGKKQVEAKHKRKADGEKAAFKAKKSPNLADSAILSLNNSDIIGLTSFGEESSDVDPYQEPEGTLANCYL